MRLGKRSSHLLHAVRQLVSVLIAERSTPGRLAWAVASGVLIGTTPFWGLHWAIALLVATVFGLNRVVVYLATNISVPIIAPLLIFGSVQLGSWCLTGAFLPLRFAQLRLVDPRDFFAAWLVGSLFLGASLGASLGVAAYFFARRFRPPRLPTPPHEAPGT
jgi:uncharacterized protein (DUF2062 family)